MSTRYFESSTGAVFYEQTTDHSRSSDIPRKHPAEDLKEITEDRYLTLRTQHRHIQKQLAQANIAKNEAVESVKRQQKQAEIKQGYDYLVGLGMPVAAAKAISGWTGA